ncbi:MAG: ATP-binding cassette domain-containing protein [Candidatus Margulisbacteria bacterium]|nr:ATP-binding cassette domain-containing protein [Candidatus Margulisiibacteriota bacterium]
MIEIKGLVKCYGDNKILDGASLVAKKKKRTTIIGQSGCGKSTLLRLILGLEDFEAGEIIIEGQSIKGLSEEEKNKLRLSFGMVFQSSALFDSLTVAENVGLVLKEHTAMTKQQIKDKVMHVLELVELEDAYHKMPSELSGGMKKRVAIARAIINDPKIILFDEPTTGLDPVTSTRTELLINKLTDYMGATSIIVTHQISTILNVSQEIYMFNEGKAIKTEGADKILQSKDKNIYNFVNGLVE